MKRLIIAVDFDGTICDGTFPDMGLPIKGALKYLLKLQGEGHELILWTCRNNESLDDAHEWMYDHDFVNLTAHEVPIIMFDAINENTDTWKERFPEFANDPTSNKVYADVYIDDKQIGGLPDWCTIYQSIKQLAEAK